MPAPSEPSASHSAPSAVNDGPPILRSRRLWRLTPREEIGREEAVFRKADHRLPEGSGSRGGSSGQRSGHGGQSRRPSEVSERVHSPSGSGRPPRTPSLRALACAPRATQPPGAGQPAGPGRHSSPRRRSRLERAPSSTSRLTSIGLQQTGQSSTYWAEPELRSTCVSNRSPQYGQCTA